MDEAIRLELEHIKDSIEELKETLKKLLDREESRLSRLTEVEISLMMHTKDAKTCQDNQKKSIDDIYKLIREARTEFETRIKGVEDRIPTAEKLREGSTRWMNYLMLLGKFVFYLSAGGSLVVLLLRSFGLIK